MGKTELTKDLLAVPFFYTDIIDPFGMEHNPITCDEIQNVIEYLKRRHVSVCRESVSKTVGIFLRLDERRDIRDLFARNNIRIGAPTKKETGDAD